MKTKIMITVTALWLISLSACKKDYIQEEVIKKYGIKKVTAQQIHPKVSAKPIYASGKLISEQEMNLSFKVGGYIQNLYVKEGQTVKAGQLLAKLDLTEIEAQVTQAEKAYEKALRDLNRINKLFTDSAATLEQKQNLETAFEIAEEDLRMAKFNLKHAQIVAPVNARVLNKKVERNELVAPGQPIYTLGSTGQAGEQKISIGISDHYIVKLALYDSAQITFDPFPNQVFTASVSNIAEGASQGTGLFKIELTLEGFHPQLKNGFIGKAMIFPSRDQEKYLIPMAALVEGHEDKATFYYSTDGRSIQQLKVSVEDISTDHFIVANHAIPEPGWVITEGAAYLSARDSVQLIKK